MKQLDLIHLLTVIPPFLIKEAEKQESGIMLEVLQNIATKLCYVLKTGGKLGKRVARKLHNGDLDSNPKPKEHVSNEEDYE